MTGLVSNLPAPVQQPSQDVNRLSSLDRVVAQMILKIKQLADEDYSRSSYLRLETLLDNGKLGNKRYVVRQPEAIQEWRHEMKALLRQYLSLKFPEERKDSVEEMKEDDEKSPLCDSETQNDGGSELRFKIKTNGLSSWYVHSGFDRLSFGKKVASLSKEERLIFQESLLARIFQGSHLEYVQREKVEKKPDSFWSGWKTIIGDAGGVLYYLPQKAQRIIYNVGSYFFPPSPSWRQYRNQIHPAIQIAALEVLKNGPTEHPNVVEICGGEGDLAMDIAGKFQKPMNYYLLEYNDLSLQAARAQIASLKNEQLESIIPIKTDVTNDRDYFTDMKKEQPMQNGSIDLIVGSGALTTYVLENMEKAVTVAKKCHALLKPKGKMILAGHSLCYLDSKDFEALGFQVINTSFVGGMSPFSSNVNHMVGVIGSWNKQFYVLEKI
jgi:hypothetical protein